MYLGHFLYLNIVFSFIYKLFKAGQIAGRFNAVFSLAAPPVFGL